MYWKSATAIIIIIGLLTPPTTNAQLVESNSEFTMRSSNSVDIQVCVSSVLSDERNDVQLVIATQLQADLSSTSVYYTRLYTTSQGTVCFLYVYQASSPEMARNSVPILLHNEATLLVRYKNNDVSCTIAAVPWQGEGYGPLGPDIPWKWTGSDVILWGGCVAGLLLFLVIAMCCFVRFSVGREQLRASDILKADRTLLGDLIVAQNVKKLKPVKKQKVLG
jgi:hypothetical protein